MEVQSKHEKYRYGSAHQILRLIDDPKAYGLLQCVCCIDHFDVTLETQPALGVMLNCPTWTVL